MADKIYAVIDTNVIVSALIAKNLESKPTKPWQTMCRYTG